MILVPLEGQAKRNPDVHRAVNLAPTRLILSRPRRLVWSPHHQLGVLVEGMSIGKTFTLTVKLI